MSFKKCLVLYLNFFIRGARVWRREAWWQGEVDPPQVGEVEEKEDNAVVLKPKHSAEKSVLVEARIYQARGDCGSVVYP